MPELPEVETIKNELLPYIIGRHISDVTLFWERMVRQPSADEFCARLKGQQVTGAGRRGKYFLINLASGDTLIIHLKMTGSLLLGDGSAEPPQYTRAVIHLDNNSAVFFRDPRKFGAMWLVDEQGPVVGKLGPEPLDSGFTPGVLAGRLSKRHAPIKALLCDQGVLAGIGNMYADEALFTAGIHPLRSGDSLSAEELERLHRAIRQVLLAGIGDKGASVQNYFRPGGEPGTAHLAFRVAHRRGEPCPVCGTPVTRLPIRNRGSYFCPSCQPRPEAAG
ncbi:MAG: bifunctional DNA-formamidopyrimidine glycosylase/DNA-(apurinic or apyrimidinic site) lyase [Chloroflexota bacterium]